MAFNFPTSPTLGDRHTVGNKTWVWNGSAWNLEVSEVQQVYANAAFSHANAAYVHANSAFIAANNATDTYVRNHANAAFDAANTNAGDIVVIQGVNVTQNTSITNLQGVDDTQNTNITSATNTGTSAFIQANAVFELANTINSNYATQIFVNTAISDLINSAPSTLDTLNELANALGDDPNFATTTATLIGNSFNKANAAFDAANTNSSNITNLQGVDNTQNTNIITATNTGTAAFIHANAAFDAANSVVGGNSFGVIYAANNSVYANAVSATDTVIFTGVNGTVVEGNATTKTITFAGTPGLQGLSVDYGLVSDALVYSLDYGTL